MKIVSSIAFVALLVLTSADADVGMPIKESIFCTLRAHPTFDERHAGGTVDLLITVKGEVLWNARPLDRVTFGQWLSAAAKEQAQPIINVIAEPDTKFSTLMPVLIRLQEYGVTTVMVGNTRLGIPALPPPK